MAAEPTSLFDPAVLCCPRCRGVLADGITALQCHACKQDYAIVAGIPLLLQADSPVTHLQHEDYDEQHYISDSSHAVIQHMWDTVCQENNLPTATVLELGCGSGQLTHALLDLPGVQCVHASDISPAFLQLAQQRCGHDPRVRYYACDANHLPFRDHSVDLVVANSVLHHLLDYPQVLQQCHALLKPGGAAVFFEPVLQGKIMVAFLASLMLRIARKTGYGQLDEADQQHIERMIRHITKAKTLGQDSARLAQMEDKYVFDLHELQDAARSAGFSHTVFRNNPAQDGQYRFNLHQHLRMAGIAEHKINDFRFLMNAAHELLIDMTPRDLITPMGFFVFKKQDP